MSGIYTRDSDALYLAVSRGDYKNSKELLDKGTDPDIKYGPSEQSPLHQAAMNGSESLVKLLLERGADKESRNRVGNTPLSYAAILGPPSHSYSATQSRGQYTYY